MEPKIKLRGPFKETSNSIGESRRNTVFGYDSLVVKTPKTGFREDVSLREIKEKSERYKESCDLVRKKIQKLEGKKEIVVDQSLIIHKSTMGGITYSRVQKKIPEAKTLGSIGTKLLGSDPKTLMNLRRIFESNIQIYKEKNCFLDIVGSTVSKQPKITKITKHLLPLFYSENIMLDKEGTPKLVDMGELTNIKNENLSTKLRCKFQIIGSHISINLINLSLMSKKYF
jgi:hypothetical protein